MIIPITLNIRGEEEPMGVADVRPDGDDFTVTFILRAGVSLRGQAKKDLEKMLKQQARKAMV